MSTVRKGVALLVLWAVVLVAVPARARAVTGSEPLRARHAMVVSQHELASKVGVEVMKRGGNAVDAAVAVGLALAVVYPEAGNIGGGGFMLIRAADGKVHAIDYREMAPAAAHRDIYVRDGELIKGEGSSTLGYRAAGVPGTLAGFDLAFRKYGSGRVRWRDVVAPARLLARNGFPLSKRVADLLRGSDTKDLALYEDSRSIFQNGGKFYREGDILRQPELAATLARIEKQGAKEFYTGLTARSIAADMTAHGGLMTLDDLRNYRAKEREPIVGTYRGHKIISMPPPSSGGIVLLEILNILEGYDLKPLRYNSAARYHLVAEAMRRAFADRAEFMGDPDFSDVPAARLIDKAYAARRRSTIDPGRASTSSDIRHGDVGGAEPTQTTHFTVMDASGMVVTNTYTLNDYFGSKVTAKGTGVLLNNEMDDFAAQPGKPNIYKLIQGERNAVGPGKRPLSAMTPTMVLRGDGSFWFALGARGGPRIISAVTQIILNVIDHDMNLEDAVDAPRVHHQWLPDEVWYEPLGFSPDTLAVLAARGHKFVEKPLNVAAATAIMADKDGFRIGVVDPRSDGAAAGY